MELIVALNLSSLPVQENSPVPSLFCKEMEPENDTLKGLHQTWGAVHETEGNLAEAGGRQQNRIARLRRIIVVSESLGRSAGPGVSIRIGCYKPLIM